jgi:hypothetical protein
MTDDALASWRDGPAKRAIVDFVRSASECQAIIEKDEAFFEGIATQDPEVVATLLKANDWRVFVCSGGGRDFMRVFAEETWGIYQERVIGSAAACTYADGRIVRSEQLLGGLDLARASPNTSSLRPAGCRRSPAGTPMWTSRCSKPRSSLCSSTTTTRTVSSPTPRPRRSRWPRPGSWAGRW